MYIMINKLNSADLLGNIKIQIIVTTNIANFLQ